MELRDFGRRSGKKVPRASMGGMRFPADTNAAVDLIRYAIDAGMRYIDTSRGYGDSEYKIGRALRNGYRDKVILSTKWSPFIMKVEETDAPTADCMYRRIRESLTRLDVDCVDYFQLWNIQNKDEFAAMTAPGAMLDGIRRAMAEGLVKRTGFTSHSTVTELRDYITTTGWADIILVSCHILNRTWEPFLTDAHAAGIGTIVMNPVGGGKLARNEGVLAELAAEVGARSPADMALRWLMANPAVDTVISGIATRADVDATIASVNAPPLAADAVGLINRRIAALKPEKVNYCTACGYCKPCPKDIDIPRVLGCIYDARFLGMTDFARANYKRMKINAAACVACGQCEKKCTQHLKITEEMRWASANLG
jgi:predicted aldo/keto reductase-like oxidoreductase